MKINREDELRITLESSGTAAAGMAEGMDKHLTAQKAPATSRMYWMDWLRVFLTVIVLLHHCVTAYVEGTFWYVQKINDPYEDPIMAVFYGFITGANQYYFMSLFFLLSGYCTPASYKRKGPLSYIKDRTLRLLVPCVVYSLTLPPFMGWMNEKVRNPALKIGEAYLYNLHVYNIANGPTWFVYMLWWFSVTYMILHMISSSAVGRRCRQMLGRMRTVESGNNSSCSSSTEPFSVKQMLKSGAIIIAVLTAAIYIARLAAAAGGVQPYGRVAKGMFVNFMPDYLAVYVLSFALGVCAVKRDALRRLPSNFGWWCLTCAGLWFVYAKFVVTESGLISGAIPLEFGTIGVATWLYSSFVEQSYAVVWSAGLVILFRDTFNTKPGTIGKHIIGAAYAVYLIHPLFLTLFGRALYPCQFYSLLINALAIFPMVVISSWVVGAGLKLVPGLHHVL